MYILQYKLLSIQENNGHGNHNSTSIFVFGTPSTHELLPLSVRFLASGQLVVYKLAFVVIARINNLQIPTLRCTGEEGCVRFGSETLVVEKVLLRFVCRYSPEKFDFKGRVGDMCTFSVWFLPRNERS